MPKRNKRSAFTIPYEVESQLVNHPKIGRFRFNKFHKWYKNHLRASTKEQEVYRQLAEALENAGMQKPVKSKTTKRQSQHKSHIASAEPEFEEQAPGSGLHFLELWYTNNQRGKHSILPYDRMQEAGLPADWEELYFMWDLQTKGQLSALGRLEDINVDDLFALARKNKKGEYTSTLDQVLARRQELDAILERAKDDPYIISNFADHYGQLYNESLGLNPYDFDENRLMYESGWNIKDTDTGEMQYIKQSSEEQEAWKQTDLLNRRTNPYAINPEEGYYDDAERTDLMIKGLYDHRTKMEGQYSQRELPLYEGPPPTDWSGKPIEGQNNQWDKENYWINRATDLGKLGLQETLGRISKPVKAVKTADQILGGLIKKQDLDLTKQYNLLTKGSNQLNLPLNYEQQLELILDEGKSRFHDSSY